MSEKPHAPVKPRDAGEMRHNVGLFSSSKPDVVGGAVFDLRAGTFLAARRTKPAALRGRWELPGGKVEGRETSQQTLARELKEELGVTVKVHERIPGSWKAAGSKPMTMHFYVATITSGTPRTLQDHDELRWLTPDRAFSVAWLDSNVDVVRKVAEVLRKKL